VAGIKSDADIIVRQVLTCKYMRWSYQDYEQAPLEFIQVIDMLRHYEAEEEKRQK